LSRQTHPKYLLKYGIKNLVQKYFFPRKGQQFAQTILLRKEMSRKIWSRTLARFSEGGQDQVQDQENPTIGNIESPGHVALTIIPESEKVGKGYLDR
jgi:hypothetical protein